MSGGEGRPYELVAVRCFGEGQRAAPVSVYRPLTRESAEALVRDLAIHRPDLRRIEIAAC